MVDYPIRGLGNRLVPVLPTHVRSVLILNTFLFFPVLYCKKVLIVFTGYYEVTMRWTQVSENGHVDA